MPSIARARSSPLRPGRSCTSNRPSEYSGASPSGEITSAMRTRYFLRHRSALQHVAERLEQLLRPVRGVIAHVADAERLVLHAAVTGRDLEAVLLHGGSDLRTREAVRTAHARNGRRAVGRIADEHLEAQFL